MLDTFHPTDPNYDWAAHYQRNRDRIAKTPLTTPREKLIVDMGCDHNAHVLCRRARLPSISSLRIVEDVAYRHGVTAADILGRRRDRITCLARQELCALLKEVKRWSYPRIGVLLGRDHTTALFYCRRHKARLASAAPDTLTFSTGKDRETRQHRRYEVQLHQVAEAVRMHRAGATETQIGAELGLRPSAVRFCVRCYIGLDRVSRARRNA